MVWLSELFVEIMISLTSDYSESVRSKKKIGYLQQHCIIRLAHLTLTAKSAIYLFVSGPRQLMNRRHQEIHSDDIDRNQPAEQSVGCSLAMHHVIHVGPDEN
jgi:hypothetical protein